MRVILCVFASCAHLKKNSFALPFVFWKQKNTQSHIYPKFLSLHVFAILSTLKNSKTSLRKPKNARDLEPKIFQRLFLTKANRTPFSRSVQTRLSDKERERARSHLILLRSKREDGPFAAHATARCTRENFLRENRTRRKKKFQKNWRERERDRFWSSGPPVSFLSLSFKLGEWEQK